MICLFWERSKLLILHFSILKIFISRRFTWKLLIFLILRGINFIIFYLIKLITFERFLLCLIKLVAFEYFFLFWNINAFWFTSCWCDKFTFEYFWRDVNTVWIHKFFGFVVLPSSLNLPNAGLDEYFFLNILIIDPLSPLSRQALILPNLSEIKLILTSDNPFGLIPSKIKLFLFILKDKLIIF